MRRYKTLILFISCWVGLLLCARIHVLSIGGGQTGCFESANCEQYLFNQNAAVLGAPIHLWAAAYFASFVIVVLLGAWLSSRYALGVATVVIKIALSLGVVAAFYSLYLQLFYFKKLCPYCLSIDGVLILAACVALNFKPIFHVRQSAVPLVLMSMQGSVALFLILSSSPVSPGSRQESMIVAKVNGKPITEEDVKKSIAVTLQPLEEMKYAAEETCLKLKIDQMIIAENAKQEGVSSEMYLSRHLGVALSYDDAAWNAKREKFIRDLRTGYNIETYLKKPLPLIVNLDLTKPIVVGDINAAVKVVIFSDFDCPFCEMMAPDLSGFFRNHPSDVVLGYWQYPLKSHKRAREAAKAAFCAEAQGKFLIYHDLLYKAQDLSDASLRSTAAKANLDLVQFDNDMKSAAMAKKVDESCAAGENLGIDGIPSVFVNGKMVGGMVSAAELEDIYKQEMAAVRTMGHH